MNVTYQKSGYLHDTCKIFYLKDYNAKEFEYHYHDFHKILIFLHGSISYAVEGREYDLLPGDVILIPAGQIHRPIIREDIPYERIITYVSQDFFDTYEKEGCPLFQCFKKMQDLQSSLVRLHDEPFHILNQISNDIVSSFTKEAFGSLLYRKTKLVEYLIQLNRFLQYESTSFHIEGIENTQISQIIKYINNNITEDLSIDSIAEKVFLNRSYIMHLFKAETGYTIGKYITEKRLFLANHYISQGDSITAACYNSGFKNYTTFYQAYRKKYKCSPKQKQMNPSK